MEFFVVAVPPALVLLAGLYWALRLFKSGDGARTLMLAAGILLAFALAVALFPQGPIIAFFNLFTPTYSGPFEELSLFLVQLTGAALTLCAGSIVLGVAASRVAGWSENRKFWTGAGYVFGLPLAGVIIVGIIGLVSVVLFP